MNNEKLVKFCEFFLKKEFRLIENKKNHLIFFYLTLKNSLFVCFFFGDKPG